MVVPSYHVIYIGTMGDDEMRQLNVPALQDEGYIFLWVTGIQRDLLVSYK